MRLKGFKRKNARGKYMQRGKLKGLLEKERRLKNWGEKTPKIVENFSYKILKEAFPKILGKKTL